MYQFNLNNEPPTARELVAVESELKQLRRNLVKKSCISDGTHALMLMVLYFGNFISGAAITVTVALSLVVALILATATREALYLSDLIAIGATAIGVITAVSAILGVGMAQPWDASCVAGLTAGSIVISGTWLGRALKAVMYSLEKLKPISVDDQAYEVLTLLCRKYPSLNQYRNQAAQNLRPHLTYGELEAMQHWHEQHGQEDRCSG